MPHDLEKCALARGCLIYATSDLLLAGIEAPEGVLLDALCYHAQQAAEKALKSRPRCLWGGFSPHSQSRCIERLGWRGL